MIGAGIERALTPAWSVSLEYDYYRFASANVSTPQTIEVTRSAAPSFRTIADGTSGVSADLQVIKLALNYHLGQDSVVGMDGCADCRDWGIRHQGASPR